METPTISSTNDSTKLPKTYIPSIILINFSDDLRQTEVENLRKYYVLKV